MINLSESQEQQSLFSFFKQAYPEIEKYLFHVPNGGTRTKIAGAKLKSEGVKKGVPDIYLEVMRGGYGGLRIEMKKQSERLKTPKLLTNGYLKTGGESKEQIEWILNLRNNGYKVEVCYGWKEAKAVILDYLNEQNPS